jgi:hypothetical protein
MPGAAEHRSNQCERGSSAEAHAQRCARDTGHDQMPSFYLCEKLQHRECDNAQPGRVPGHPMPSIALTSNVDGCQAMKSDSRPTRPGAANTNFALATCPKRWEHNKNKNASPSGTQRSSCGLQSINDPTQRIHAGAAAARAAL